MKIKLITLQRRALDKSFITQIHQSIKNVQFEFRIQNVERIAFSRYKLIWRFVNKSHAFFTNTTDNK